MANENQNTGPNLQGGDQQSKKSILDAKAALRELIDDQGDYNNLLKMSLRDLDNMQKAYTRISAKIDSLNKGAINVKQVQQELARLTQKEYIAKQKVIDLEAGLSKETLKQQKNAETLNSLYKKAVTEKERERIQRQINVNNAKLEANIELKNLEYAKVAAKISEEEKRTGESILETEKKVSKQMGISGNLAKLLADKLGVGEEAYEAMSFQARKLVKEQGDQVTNTGKWKVAAKGIGAASKALVSKAFDPAMIAGGVVGAYKLASAGLDMVGNAASSAGNFLAGMSKHSGTIVRDLTSGVSGLLKNIPLVGGLLGGLVEGFSALLDLMLGVDDYAVKIGRQLNMSAGSAASLARSYREISFTNGDIFITAEKLLESQAELASTLGVVNNLGGDILAKNIKLKDFAGLELDTRAKLAELSKTSGTDATNAILAQVKGIQRATGIAFQYQSVLKEAASQSGYLGLQFAKYPAQMTKTLLTVKAMGMELKQLDSIADSLLDFESSISKEFEAQLLTGKEINLTKAREAFLNNDLATAAAEITKQVGSTEDFLKLNRIQADSLASSFGMSRDQMGEMLKQQELLAKLGAKQGDSAREQLRLGLERYGNEKALSEAIGEQAYQSMVNASTQEKLAAMIEKIKESIVSFVMESGILDKVKEFINYVSDPKNVREILKKVQSFFADAVEFIGTAAAEIINALDYVAFGQIPNDFIASIRTGSANMANQIRSFGGGVATTTPSVESTAAKEKVNSGSSSTGTSTSSQQSDTSMAAPKVYVIVTVDPITGKSVEKVVTRDVYEKSFGQMGKK